VLEVLGKPFPDDRAALWAASEPYSRAEGSAHLYRRIEGIRMNGHCSQCAGHGFATWRHLSHGRGFTRNPPQEKTILRRMADQRQGEDVVAGIRTPSLLNEDTKNEQNKHLASLETAWRAHTRN